MRHEELKRCPLCGGKAVISSVEKEKYEKYIVGTIGGLRRKTRNKYVWYVKCFIPIWSCGLKTNFMYKRNDAMEYWNLLPRYDYYPIEFVSNKDKKNER